MLSEQESISPAGHTEEILVAQDTLYATGVHTYGDDGRCTGCGIGRLTEGLIFTTTTYNRAQCACLSGKGSATGDDIVIPSVGDGYPVYIIDREVFMWSQIVSVTIPRTVQLIRPLAFGHCSRLTTINYQGTVAQWNAVSKTAGWDEGTTDYTVCCTDGTIDFNGNVTYYE